MPRTNWAGNLTYAASRLVAPKTLGEAQEAVRGATKVRALGSRHCFNDIADTTGIQISLEHLKRVVSLDRDKRKVTVEGGIRYSDLGPTLHEQGFALHNLASLPHITIAGACATATHGSGATLGNLATAVAGLEFINGAGDLVSLSRDNDPDTFPGAVVNLGALGIVTKLTLDVLPTFEMRQQVYRDLPADALFAHFDEVMASGYSVSLFTPWLGDAIQQVWVKSTLDADTGFADRLSSLGARPATEPTHPVLGLDTANCTAQMGVVGPAYDRLPHFRIDSIPAGGGDYQAEYFVPKQYAVAAAKAVHALGPRLAPTLMVSEVRTMTADDLWMSPCYRQPCVAFHFSFNPDWPAIKERLPDLEAALAPYEPRPHWGKLFTMPPQTVRARYGKLDAFKALIETHDPGGKFRNDFVDRNIFGRA